MAQRKAASYSQGVLKKLPGWVIPNDESVRREAEPYRNMSDAQRGALIRTVCRSVGVIARGTNREQEISHWEDPLPEDSKRALERLRREYRLKRGLPARVGE